MNKLTIEMTEDEAREYLRFKRIKSHAEDEAARLANELEALAKFVYGAIILSEVSGVTEIINESNARAALLKAERILF